MSQTERNTFLGLIRLQASGLRPRAVEGNPPKGKVPLYPDANGAHTCLCFPRAVGELTLPVHARKRGLMTKGLWIVPEQCVCLPHGTQLSSCSFPGGAEICSVYLTIRGFKGNVHLGFRQMLPPTPLCLGPGSPESRVSATDWMCTVIWGPILGKRSEEWGD